MTLPPLSIVAFGITFLVGAGGGAGILVVEALVSRRREVPILTVRRREIKYCKHKSNNSERDMCVSFVGGDIGGIARSRRNERHMESYNEIT